MNIKRNLFSIFVLFLLFSVLTTNLNAITARQFRVMLDGDNINLKKDHYSVFLVGGRISSKDNIFRALISRNSSLIGSFNQTVTFFGAKQESVASLIQETDIRRKIDRPLSKIGVLLENIPADAQTNYAIKIAINREEQLTKIFDALEKTKPELGGAANAFAGPWLGYTKAVTQIVNQVFGADKTKYPLVADLDVKIPQVTANGEMKPHYIILLAPLRDGDEVVSAFSESKMKFQDGKLWHDAKEVTERSYIVLQVVKGEGFDIPRMMDSVDAPWANFAKTQIINASMPSIETEQQLKTFSDGLLNQLNAADSLLQRELRFSGYDRAVGLVYFAEKAKKRIDDRCKAIPVANGKCPTSDIARFIDDYLDRQGIERNVVNEVRTNSLNP